MFADGLQALDDPEAIPPVRKSETGPRVRSRRGATPLVPGQDGPMPGNAEPDILFIFLPIPRWWDSGDDVGTCSRPCSQL